MTTPKRIAVTGAAGQIGYSLLPRLAAGGVFGPDVPVILQLLEITPVLKVLEGVRMELEDCAFPLLHGIECSDDPKVAFKDADLALLVGSKPRGKGMERKDLIAENGPIFTGQGRALNEVGGPDLRVAVVGNPCNTNCLIALHSAPDVPNDRFTAMTRLDQNRAMAQLAGKSGKHWSTIRGMTIWGNHSNTQYPDWHHATIDGKKAADMIGDDAWLKSTFISTVQERGKAIINARGSSSAASAASALVDHCHDLYHPRGKSDPVSICVYSEGAYDVPEGIISSFPCTTDGKGGWSIIEGLEVNDFSREKITRTTNELLEEREIVKDLLA